MYTLMIPFSGLSTTNVTIIYHLLEAARSKVALFHLMADGISYLRLDPFTAHCLHAAFATCPGIRSQNRNEFVWLNSAIPNPTTKKTCFLTAITSTSPTCLLYFVVANI